MSRKDDRRNKVFVGKSLYRKIARHSLPEEGRDLVMDTKYGKQHLGIYKHPKFLAYIPGFKKFMPFGRMEITKWEYVKVEAHGGSNENKPAAS
jgi:hypothetical protein